MAKKTTEQKLAEALAEAMNNVEFSPSLLSNFLVFQTSHYTQDKLINLLEVILTHQNLRFHQDLAVHNETSHGLVIAKEWYQTLEANDQLQLEFDFS